MNQNIDDFSALKGNDERGFARLAEVRQLLVVCIVETLEESFILTDEPDMWREPVMWRSCGGRGAGHVAGAEESFTLTDKPVVWREPPLWWVR